MRDGKKKKRYPRHSLQKSLKLGERCSIYSSVIPGSESTKREKRTESSLINYSNIYCVYHVRFSSRQWRIRGN